MGGRDEPSSPIERLVHNLAVRSGYASLVAHIAILIGMALLMLPASAPPRLRPLELGWSSPDQGHEAGTSGDAGAADATPELVLVESTDTAEPAAAPHSAQPPSTTTADDHTPALEIASESAHDEGHRATGIAARAASLSHVPSPAPTIDLEKAFGPRRGRNRGTWAAGRGGSAASEEAVERGLAWLARHQTADGSWRCDLADCRCDGRCRDPGTVSSTTAATGIALLPFLGAGSTHVDGPYRETVNRGIYYLLSRMQPTERGGDLCEGTMYGHGTATLALAEALGMTRDEALIRPVRDAVRFIELAQDLHGGGWRYLPRQPGDMTVTAWQLASLKSAALAGVAVPSPTLDGVSRFLDRVQVRHGEAYGYQSPHERPCTSAIGLLCRLYMGWPDEATVDRGLTSLARKGPDPDAIYLNFYLSQALLQRDHPLWQRWNKRNRDQLVAHQSRTGHEDGSWFAADEHTAPGGRLAHTALAVLTLEVYYRLLPIYGPDAVAGDW